MNTINSNSHSSKRRSNGSFSLKRKLWALLVMFAMVFSLLPAAPAQADSDPISYDTLYRWTGLGITGTRSNTMQFKMTDGYIAFCVDENTVIKDFIDYVKVPLDHSESSNMFDNESADPDKIRAILTYAWDKTDPDEITAIQYALWNEMHGTSLPGSVNNNIKAIFDKLVDDSQTPPISAAGINQNSFTLNSPSPDSKQYIFDPATTEYSFDFEAFSGANIVFTVFDENDDEMATDDYEITDNGSGSYTLKLKDVAGPAGFRLEATTLKDTAVEAFVFMSINDDSEEINIKRSQTVAGIKLSDTTQTKSFDVELYYAASGSLDLSGMKTLTGRDLVEGEFTFELYEGDDTSGEPFRTANNDSFGYFSFETIDFTQNDTGTKTYTVVERPGELGGVEYDENSYTVTVEITDNENGTLTVTPSFSGNNDGIVFNNTYSASGSISFSGMKILTGRDLEEGEFTFELYEQSEPIYEDYPDQIRLADIEDGEPIRTATNDEDGSFSFESISFTQADVGTRVYTIVEQTGDLGGVEYDDTVYTFIIHIEDNGDGTLNIYFDEESDDPEAIGFTNSYTATGSFDLSGTKTLTGRDLTADEFTFELYEGDDTSGEPFRTATNDAEGSFSFETITYTQDEIGTWTYTIAEQIGDLEGIIYDTNTYTIVVSVTDNGDGTLAVETTDDSDDPESINFFNSVVEEEDPPLTEPTTEPTVTTPTTPTLPTINPAITLPLASATPTVPTAPTLPTISVVQEQVPQAGENAPLWPIGAALIIIAGGMAYLLNRKERTDND